MKKTISKRAAYGIGFLLVIFLLGFAFYLEVVEHILACPLCILQRICLVMVGVVFAIGGLFSLKRWGLTLTAFFALIFSFLGLLLSGRQVWLQHNPLNLDANCDVSFQYMLSVMPWDEVIKKVLHGGTECSQINWQFMQLSLAEWSFIWFIFFCIFSFWQLIRK